MTGTGTATEVPAGLRGPGPARDGADLRLWTALAEAAAAVAGDETRGRIVEATLGCLARWGPAKTTLDDIARDAGVSRATVYRAFPGGKDAVIAAAVRHEIIRVTEAARAALTSGAPLVDRLTDAVVATARELADHPALGYLVAHEPEVVLEHLAFDGLDRLLALAVAFLTPHLEADLGPEAPEVAELVTRLVVSHLLCPSGSTDLTDPASVRRLVGRLVAVREPDVPAGPRTPGTPREPRASDSSDTSDTPDKEDT